MMRALKLLALFAALLLAALADSVSTDPVGFVTLTTLSNSDTIFSTPLARPEVFRGAIASVVNDTVTVSGNPGWTTGAFAYNATTQHNTYYLRFRTGAKAGSFYTVTTNTTNSLTLDLAGDLLTGVTANDEFAIVPYWTLSTVFPASSAGTSFLASSSPATRETEILFPDVNKIGINASAVATYYFYSTLGHWLKIGGGANSFDDTALPPDSFVLVRNKNFTGSISILGGVQMAPQATPLNSYPSGAQDNFVAITYPVPVSLNNLNLVSSGVFSVSNSPASRTDELLVFDNTTTGLNKSAASTYYYWSGKWLKIGNGATDVGATLVFQPGTGFVIRKAANAGGPATQMWSFTANP